MAFTTGTASGYLDLLDDLRTFLLGLGTYPWASNRYTTTSTSAELWLEGQGSAGTESIHVGIRAYEDAGAPYFNFELKGATGFSSGEDFNNQPGTSSGVYVPLDDDSMPYWFVGNSRRFVVVAKIGTVYSAFYCGLGLPYGTPSQYPYPLFIGGQNLDSTIKTSNTDHRNRHFVDPGDNATYLYGPGGTWLDFENFGGTTSLQVRNDRCVWPYQFVAGNRSILEELRDGPDDATYALLPLILHSDSPSRNVYMELEGCFYVSGFNQAAENTITIDTVDYILFPNVFRTDRFNFWALGLE